MNEEHFLASPYDHLKSSWGLLGRLMSKQRVILAVRVQGIRKRETVGSDSAARQ